MAEENENVEQSKVEPGSAIQGNFVILNVIKASFGLDLAPQSKTKSSSWGSFEPNGLLPVAIELQDFDFCQLEDGSHVLSEQGVRDLLAKLSMTGVPGIRTSYDKMLRRESDDEEDDYRGGNF